MSERRDFYPTLLLFAKEFAISQNLTIKSIHLRRDGRVVEGTPLLREHTPKAYQEFESLSLRHLNVVSGAPGGFRMQRFQTVMIAAALAALSVFATACNQESKIIDKATFKVSDN